MNTAPLLTAAIEVDPPIPYIDLTARADADANDADHSRTTGYPMYRYLFDGVDIGDLTFGLDRHHSSGPCATAIFAWKQPVDGYYRCAALERIITDFARTTDGTPRTFTGHLESERGGRPTRLYIRGGEPVEIEPELVWHEPPDPPADTAEEPARDHGQSHERPKR